MERGNVQERINVLFLFLRPEDILYPSQELDLRGCLSSDSAITSRALCTAGSPGV